MRSTLFALAVIAASARTAAAEKDPVRRDTTGFYPLWENTGHVERHAEVHFGTTGVQIGLGDVAHIGVQPINYFYRTPNGYAKVALYESETARLAAQVGLFHLLPGATRAFYSPMYTSRVDNPDFGITLIPVALSLSTELGEYIELHHTVTALGVLGSGPIEDRADVGYSVIAELNPSGRHALTIHAGEIGFWNHDQAFGGVAYRYRSTWLELRLGYFYRFTEAGAQGAPLVALGFLL